MKRAGVLLTAALAVLLPGSPAVAATTAPPPLIEEVLTGDLSPHAIGACDETAPSTFTFSSQGPATGDYPGTYSETGSFTLDVSQGPSPYYPRPLTAFSASFTILSGDTVITGTKSMTTRAGVEQIGACNPDANTANFEGICTYSATIQSPQGDFTDRGQCSDSMADNNVFGPGNFYEGLTSDLTAVIPVNTPGESTGGGKIAPDITFGFNAMNGNGGLKGTCNVVDEATPAHIRCLDVTSYAQTATHATFSGHADVDGTATSYRIDVDDNGEPGTADTFAIVTGSGYTAGGVLTDGNIQVHPTR